MESYIQITLLNDFLFCPRSIYFHRLYEKYEWQNYKDTPQLKGTLNHETIEDKTYSTRKELLQGLPVWSEQYTLCGKIDVFNTKTGELIERKTHIKYVYDGYKYQLYAQYFCLQEMGYEVKKLFLHSLKDNKRYEIPLPNEEEKQKFATLVQEVQDFSLHTPFTPNSEKCKNCIYAGLCDKTEDIF
jgi:CRISPR-associated protein Cas4